MNGPTQGGSDVRATSTYDGAPLRLLLARYRAVLTAAWTHRRELAGPTRLATEVAFLPAALSLQETPVHPAPRRAAWVICALFVFAAAWSWFGEVDIVAVAPGRIVVSDRSKVVQPLESGVVKAIHVRDGDRVHQGQLLVELDATQAQADAARVAEERAAALSEAMRSLALANALAAGAVAQRPILQDPPEGWPEHVRASATVQLLSEWTDIRAKLAKLDSELAHRHAELQTAREVIAKLEAALPLVRQRESDYQALAAQGFTSSHGTQDRTRERIEMERDLATAQAHQAEAQAALTESQQTRIAFVAETQRSLRQRQAEAELKVAQLREEAVKSIQRTDLTRLTAPVDGTVQQLAVHTAGGVVTPAQTLLVVVPAEGALSIEAALENKDIGFVSKGQVAEVKLETFPFTRFGTLRATVAAISADAVVDEKRGAAFPITLALTDNALDVNGRMIRVAPGMNVTAEIKTGRQKVFEYLVSPIKRRLHESVQDR